MKNPLDRTVILSSKDLLEQPENLPYIVMIPDTNIVIAADTVDVYKEEVIVRIGDKIVSRFSTAMTWICVARETVEIMRREDQIKRQVDNARAEKDLADSLMTEEEKAKMKVTEQVIKEQMERIAGARGNEGFGMYL